MAGFGQPAAISHPAVLLAEGNVAVPQIVK
jgi:hypothetical protein